MHHGITPIFDFLGVQNFEEAAQISNTDLNFPSWFRIWVAHQNHGGEHIYFCSNRGFFWYQQGQLLFTKNGKSLKFGYWIFFILDNPRNRDGNFESWLCIWIVNRNQRVHVSLRFSYRGLKCIQQRRLRHGMTPNFGLFGVLIFEKGTKLTKKKTVNADLDVVSVCNFLALGLTWCFVNLNFLPCIWPPLVNFCL